MRLYNLILFFSFSLFPFSIFSHGFADHTLIRNTKNSWWALDQVPILYERNKKPAVLSYDCAANAWRSRNVMGVASAVSNCHMRISFDNRSFNDIMCTPSQAFYLWVNKKWVCAYQLKKGDLLLAKDNKAVAVTRIKFIQKTLPVLSIEVANTHTFCVGTYNIVTHNMFVPDMAMNTIPIFSAAGLGASVGILSNPVTATIVGSVILCGVIGYIIKSWANNKTVHYKLNYDTDKIGVYFNDKNAKHSIDKKIINRGAVIGGSGVPDPEDPKKNKNNKKNEGLKNQSEKSLRRGIRSLQKEIKKHKRKINLFQENPDKYDNKGFLKNAQSLEHRNNIIRTRIQGVEKEVMKFKREIARHMEELSRRGLE